MVVFKSHEFRITAHDLARSTAALRHTYSPFNLYLGWRHEQIERLGLDFYKEEESLADGFQNHYGKIDRIALVNSFLQSCRAVPGDVAEFGVYRGHTAAAMNQILEKEQVGKHLYLFDSFAGIPEVTHPMDGAWKKGDLASSVDTVSKLFQDSSRVKIVQGFFSETLPTYPDLRFSFCHVDADLYTSIRECIDYILPRLSEGGVIMFDDYGFADCPGAKTAITESFGSEFPNFVALPTGQAVYFRRSEDGVNMKITSGSQC